MGGGSIAEGDFPADLEAAAADRFADRAVGAVERDEAEFDGAFEVF